jgi:hypothetical protein
VIHAKVIHCKGEIPKPDRSIARQISPNNLATIDPKPALTQEPIHHLGIRLISRQRNARDDDFTFRITLCDKLRILQSDLREYGRPMQQ